MTAYPQQDEYLLPSQDFTPAYMALYHSGELHRRVQQGLELLLRCELCPRRCGVNRVQGKTAVCQTGRYARVSSYFPHHGEEFCLRGWGGSGTIFFTGCSLRCVFCQNADISRNCESGLEVTPKELAYMMLDLQDMGCHNINFVTPEHVVPQILEALPIAIKRGLHLPLVYNTSGYDSPESLHLMDGVVDIYMPDFKMWDEEVAHRYLKARDYPEVARQALKEMYRQVGDLMLDENGLAKRGILLRHLIMPMGIAGTEHVMPFIAKEISPNTFVNVMGQYHPAGLVSSKKHNEINRRITRQEYQRAQRVTAVSGLWRLDKARVV